MPAARVLSVNRGQEADLVIGGRPERSAIDKRPADCSVELGPLGLAGDTVADKVNHGGLEQAVYAYSRDDLDWWAEQLRRELRNGMFGENLTTAGIDVSGALIGEIWRAGTAVLQVTSPRIPCNTFKAWMGKEPQWVKRFAAAGRPGAYLRVLTPGTVAAGDDLEVVSRPAVAVTVAESMAAYYGDHNLMRRLLEVEGRSSKWDEIAAHVLGRV
jgi:MOSC domain-containing protein YiiM